LFCINNASHKAARLDQYRHLCRLAEVTIRYVAACMSLNAHTHTYTQTHTHSYTHVIMQLAVFVVDATSICRIFKSTVINTN